MTWDLYDAVLAETQAIIDNCPLCKSVLVECGVHKDVNLDIDEFGECGSCRAEPGDSAWETPCHCDFEKIAKHLQEGDTPVLFADDYPDDIEDPLGTEPFDDELPEVVGCYYCESPDHRWNECEAYSDDLDSFHSSDQYAPLTCTNCNDPSHSTSACPEPRDCGFCGSSLHLTDDCDSYNTKIPAAKADPYYEDMFCGTCYGTDHESGNCKLNDDIAFLDSLPAAQATLPLVSASPVADVFEDENMILIPADPYEPCYDREGTKFDCSHGRLVECRECKVGREFQDHQWRPFRKDGVYNVAKRNKQQKREQKSKGYQPSNKAKDAVKETKTPPKELKKCTSCKYAEPNHSTSCYKNPKKTTTPATTGAATSYGYGTTYMGKDRHYGDTYTVYDSSVTFYVSSMWNDRKEGEFVPDWGLYFDWGWKPWWRAEHIHWPDYSIPSHDLIAFEQLVVAIEKAKSGLKVEMGCIGAHGRTGTALAAIDVMLGQDPDEAIKHVRKHHCNHAIESKIQEWWIHWVASQVNGTPCPPKPVTQSYTSQGATAGTNNAGCSEYDHFMSWLWLPTGKDSYCPKKGRECTYWEQDYNKFAKGSLPVLPAGTIQLAGVDTVRGFLVPRQTYKSPEKPGGRHVEQPTKHNAKFGCMCDVCRYIERGHGAMLCPAESTKKAEWLKSMDLREKWALEEASDRKCVDIARLVANHTNTPPANAGTLLQVMKAAGIIPDEFTTIAGWKAAEAKAKAKETAANKGAREITVNLAIAKTDLIIPATSKETFGVNDVGCAVSGPGIPFEAKIVGYKGPKCVRMDKAPFRAGSVKIKVHEYESATVKPIIINPTATKEVVPPFGIPLGDPPPEPEVINIACPDGTIMQVAVGQEMLDTHPVPSNVMIDPVTGVARFPQEGERSGDYEWVVDPTSKTARWVLQTVAKKSEDAEEREKQSRKEAKDRIQQRLDARKKAASEGLVVDATIVKEKETTS